ncbi:MAG: SUF system NifU family Fe-S cluster assembly protein [Candidatus Zixiibacteriota bacterium]|nr:MAG: SUF system NifU family Fe-S cluster assembly protein [candidate division Zixibacteria bacterium]
MTNSLDELYREIILDHYRSPRGKKPVDKVDIASDGQNPSCGDEIAVQVTMDDGTVKDVHVDCKGCAISIASGSMLAEYTKGKSLGEVKQLADTVKKMLKGEGDEIPPELEDLDALKGVRKFPVRIKCALLAWMTLVEGLKNYENGKTGQTPLVSTEDES